MVPPSTRRPCGARPADGQTPPRPLGLGGRGVYGPEVDPIGTRLLYNKHLWDLNVWRVALLPSGLPAGKPEPLLRSNLVDEAAAFSPDGSSIAFVSERSGTRELWLADAEGGRLRPLTALDSAWGLYPVWEPHGEWIEAMQVAARRQAAELFPKDHQYNPGQANERAKELYEKDNADVIVACSNSAAA